LGEAFSVKNITGTIADIIQKHPFLHVFWIMIASALGAVCITGLTIGEKQWFPGLEVNNSFEVWFRDDDPGRVTYDQIKEYFGGDEFVIVAYKTENLFEKEELKKLKELTERFYELPDVRDVISLTNVDDFRSEGDMLIIEDLFETIPETDQALRKKKGRVLSNMLFSGNVISPDGKTTALLIKVSTNPQEENYQRKLTDRIYKICEEENEAGKYQFHVAGSTILVGEEDKASTDDVALEYGLMIGLLVFFLYISFKRVVLVIAPLAIVVIANLWTHAMLPIFGSSYNMVTAIIASLVMVIGIADAIHLISEYNLQLRKHAVKKAAKKAFMIVVIPCFFTSITTAAGFMSMMVSELVPIKDFGLFSGVAMLFTLVANMVVMTVVLTFLKSPKKAASQRQIEHTETKPSFLDKAMVWVASVNRRHVKINLVLALVIVAVAITGISRIEVNTNEVDYFDATHPYPTSIRFIEENLTGTMSVEVLLTGDHNTFKRPDVLQKIERLQRYIDDYPEVVKTYSVNDYLKEINKVMNGEDASFYRIPETQALVAQYLILTDESITDYLDTTTFSAARIHGRLNNLDSTRMKEISAEIENEMSKLFVNDGVEVELTGTMKLYVNAVDYVIESQIMGFSLALVVIFILLSLLVRSFSLGLLAMIPNVIPIFLTFGIMGWVGINLDFGTVIVASVSIGLAVDDTIHFISRFRHFYDRTGNYDDAIDLTITHVGQPITITTVVLFFGFMALIISTFKPIMYFGLLASITMISALIADLFVLPALIKVFKPFGADRQVSQ